jgi:hypothetical protein
MKAILEFNLPEDDYDYSLCRDASRFKSILIDMENWLRKKVKYENEAMSEDEFKAYCDCLDTFTNMINEENINLYN